MFIFGLCSTSEDRPSDLSKKSLTEMQKNEEGPLSHQKIKCSFLDYIQLLMIGWAIWAKNIDRKGKKWRRPSKSSKIKCSFLDYVQLLMIGRAIWAKNINQNTKTRKRPLSHQKIKCSFLDYIQLLMIGCLIWVVNGDWNAKKQPPESSKNKMFIFWWKRPPYHCQNQQKTKMAEDIFKITRRLVQLLMIGQAETDLSRPAEDCQKTTRPSAAIWAKNIDQNVKKKNKKRPPKSSKNKMFIFGLHSTSDDQLSDLSKKHWPKHKKMKRAPKSSKNKMSIFGLHSTSDDWPSDMSKKHQPKCTKMKKTP